MASLEDRLRAAQGGKSLEDRLTAAQQGPGKKPASRTFGDAAISAIHNFPASALKFGEDLVQPFVKPAETYDALMSMVMGLIQKVDPDALRHFPPEASGKANAVVEAVGDHLVNRYGSIDAVKNTLATDPVGLTADVSAVLTGAGGLASRAPGAVGRAGSVVAKAGRMADPVNVVAKGVRHGIGLTGKTVAELGTRTGSQALEAGFKASRKGGAPARAFRDALRGQGSMEDAVEAARGALSSMFQQRSDDYVRNVANLGRDKTELSLRGVEVAVRNARNKVRSGRTGRILDADANKMLGEIEDIVTAYRNGPPEFRTPLALDEMKREIYALAYKGGQPRLPRGSLSRSIHGEVAGAVKDAIVQQAPDYAKAMRDYSSASDQLFEIERALSLGEKATVDTASRKLLSIFRNNANTNYGQRARLGKDLMARSDTLEPMLAGQMMNAPFARGINELGRGATFGAPIAYMTNHPWLAAGLAGGAALSSPRGLGEAANIAGFIDRFTPPMGFAQPVARGAYYSGRIPLDEELNARR